MSVLNFLTSMASDALLSSAEQSSIAVSLKTLQAGLAAHFESGAIEQHFRFGSSTRGTILPRSMDERSDIDYMIVFRDNGAVPQTHGHVVVDAGTDPLDHASAQHQFMADDFGIGRGFFKGRNKKPGGAHDGEFFLKREGYNRPNFKGLAGRCIQSLYKWL